MLDWCIIGGGLHGTHLSIMLTQVAGVPLDKIRVIDPFDEPLAVWNRCTSNVGMQYLRSSLVHHLGVRPMDLWSYGGGKKGHTEYNHFQGQYRRPAYQLFQKHCQDVVSQSDCKKVRLKARANRIERKPSGWRVNTDKGDVEARRLVLCLGMSEQPRWPEWAKEYRGASPQVHHLFDPKFSLRELPSDEHIAIVGAGMSGVQAAIHLAEKSPGNIDLIARKPVTCAEFDSAACFMGDKCMGKFRNIRDMGDRRRVIKSARKTGSITPSVHWSLMASVQQDKLRLHTGEPNGLSLDEGGNPKLQLASGTTQQFDRVVLATGFESRRPGGQLIDTLIDDAGLPVASCGYPIVEKNLTWGENLHVTGPLAELEMGPVSRNIIGARQAASRIVACA
jgi:thioredoxin reductase